MTRPEQVRLVEVAPRDGLQNETGQVTTQSKVELIRRLAHAGLCDIEAAAFVSPRWVPQMAGSGEVMRAVNAERHDWPSARYSALTPNLRGLEDALAAGVDEVAVFAAASESFSQRNINCSITESLQRFEPVMTRAAAAGVSVRGYISCVAGCPYEGQVSPQRVAEVARALRDMGCYEISLGDTIGTGNPDSIRRMLEAVLRDIPATRLAGHYHDTYGMAIANIHASLELGLGVFDASVAGLGGCPYAVGASGNVATEDVLWLLHGLGYDTEVDLDQVVSTAHWISDVLQRPPASRVARALLAGNCAA